MNGTRRRLAWTAAALLVGTSWSTVARSAALPVTATLRIQLNGGASTAPIMGTGIATVNGSGGGVHVSSLALDAGLLSTVALVTPVTDPSAAPIEGLRLTAANDAGAFTETTMGSLIGTMALMGVAKACLFAPCGGAIANLSVPLSVVGLGGSVIATNGSVQITVTGAPWTTGTASIMNIFATETAMGGRTGTAQPSGAIQLVTPFVVSTSVNVVPIAGFAYLTLHFVPEPMTLASLGIGIAALAIAARRRRSG
jgi:hypothetical protein